MQSNTATANPPTTATASAPAVCDFDCDADDDGDYDHAAVDSCCVFPFFVLDVGACVLIYILDNPTGSYQHSCQEPLAVGRVLCEPRLSDNWQWQEVPRSNLRVIEQ